MTLLSSLFVKDAWFPLIVFDFVGACFSTTSEKFHLIWNMNHLFGKDQLIFDLVHEQNFVC